MATATGNDTTTTGNDTTTTHTMQVNPLVAAAATPIYVVKQDKPKKFNSQDFKR